MKNLMGMEVVVLASGIRYRGILKEITEEQVNLQARTGWRQIPMEQVTDILSVGDTRKTHLVPIGEWKEF